MFTNELLLKCYYIYTFVKLHRKDILVPTTNSTNSRLRLFTKNLHYSLISYVYHKDINIFLFYINRIYNMTITCPYTGQSSRYI